MTKSPVTHQSRSDLSIDQQHEVRTAATRLQRDFDGSFGVETIDGFLHSSYDQLQHEQQFPTSCRYWPNVSRANA